MEAQVAVIVVPGATELTFGADDIWKTLDELSVPVGREFFAFWLVAVCTRELFLAGDRCIMNHKYFQRAHKFTNI